MLPRDYCRQNRSESLFEAGFLAKVWSAFENSRAACWESLEKVSVPKFAIMRGLHPAERLRHHLLRPPMPRPSRQLSHSPLLLMRSLLFPAAAWIHGLGLTRCSRIENPSWRQTTRSTWPHCKRTLNPTWTSQLRWLSNQL